MAAPERHRADQASGLKIGPVEAGTPKKAFKSSDQAGNSPRQYYELLRDSPCFRVIWIGEVRNKGVFHFADLALQAHGQDAIL